MEQRRPTSSFAHAHEMPSSTTYRLWGSACGALMATCALFCAGSALYEAGQALVTHDPQDWRHAGGALGLGVAMGAFATAFHYGGKGFGYLSDELDYALGTRPRP